MLFSGGASRRCLSERRAWVEVWLVGTLGSQRNWQVAADSYRFELFSVQLLYRRLFTVFNLFCSLL